MDFSNSEAAGSNDVEEVRNDGPFSSYTNYPAVDLPENPLESILAGEIFEPLVRPSPRKNTHRPDFPPGFSPYDDQRDPIANPDAYPPNAREPFKELIAKILSEFCNRGLPLFDTYGLRLWEGMLRLLPLLKAIGIAFLALAVPMLFWVATFEAWRNYNVWLYYIYYHVEGTPGYFSQQHECSQVLSEGSSCRSTITSQLWRMRGCEGSLDRSAAQSTFIKLTFDGLVNAFFAIFLSSPRGVLHFIFLFLLYGYLAGRAVDYGSFLCRLAIWLWDRRIWPLVLDICDWPWLRDSLLIPSAKKVRAVGIAMWAVIIGLHVIAIRPDQLLQTPQGPAFNEPFNLVGENLLQEDEPGGPAGAGDLQNGSDAESDGQQFEEQPDMTGLLALAEEVEQDAYRRFR